MIAASRRNRPISATGLSACLVLAVGWSSAHAQDRVYVLDTTGQALLAVDLRTGQPTARTPLDVAAKELLASPDQAHLVALAPGAHKATFCCGYQPKSPITATVFDADTLQKTAGVEVGWGMPTITVAGFELLSPRAALLPSVDGRRVTILCAGYRSKKPEETLPRELVTIELDSGRVAGRVALDRPVALVGRVADTETAVLLAEAQTGKEPMAAEIILADLTQQAVTERIRLEGAPTRPFITADGGWLYLLDPGKPSNKKDKNVDGSLHVVSLRERKLVATVGAGSDPRTFFWDEDRQLALLPSDGPPVEKSETRKGELRVLRAGELVATIEVAGQPHFVRTAGSRAYVAGRDAISVVSLDDMRVAGEVRVEKAEETTEIVFSPDKKRAFALFRESSRLSVLDLESPRLVGSVTTGRGGVKFAKTLGAAALSAAATTASYYQGQSIAQTQGQRYFTYNIYTFGVATPQTSVVVRPDGEFAYALNTQTNDVTVVDASRATVVSKEPAKGRSLALLTGGAKIAVLGENELRLIDTRAHRAGEPLPFQDSGGVRLLFTPDGQTAVAYGGKDLYLLDGQTGAVRARVAGLMSVSAVMFGGATAEKP